jgi:hypothetical protein
LRLLLALSSDPVVGWNRQPSSSLGSFVVKCSLAAVEKCPYSFWLEGGGIDIADQSLSSSYL